MRLPVESSLRMSAACRNGARERSEEIPSAAIPEVLPCLEHYLGGKFDNAPFAAACNLPKRTREPVQLGTHSVPLRVIEAFVHVPTKLVVKTFVESNILAEGDIPIFLPRSPPDPRGI